MRRIMRAAVVAVVGLGAFACRSNAPAPAAESGETHGIQIATDAYVAYQHSDCETVYRLTQPDSIDAMQETEVRYSLRLVRGFCQELDGDQPAARVTYRRVLDESRTSFAAADARERLRILDLLADDPGYEQRVEQAARRVRRPVAPREARERPPALYPPLARATGVEGFVVVEFGVGRDGKTIDPLVVDSDPPFLFEGTVLRAVRSWEYRSQRSADPDQRHVIRIVFRTAVEPSLVEDAEGAATPPRAAPP